MVAYYYTRDHLGSVRELTNSSGTLVTRLDYDPWGRVTVISGTTLPDIQYAGYYTHQTSGLNLTMFRAYDPNAGRWLSRDPLGEGADATLYSYVGNDPVCLVDPLGLAPPFTIYHGTPPNSQVFTAPNGQTFLAPAGTNFQNIYNLGQTNGSLGINSAIGHYGTCDFQRNGGNGYSSKGNTFYPAYTNASNYAVGVYMNGAGYSLNSTLSVASGFAGLFSSNAGSSALSSWQTQGWNAAQSGSPNGAPTFTVGGVTYTINVNP
jgi:RHS repeat-associated protein